MAILSLKKEDHARIYLPITVKEAARIRISWIFDSFPNIVVSVSGGKDSTVLFDLVYKEAEKRSRTIQVFFLDQEVEYESTIKVMRNIMYRPLVDPLWYQCSIRMTNATSYNQRFLNAWGEGEQWMRDKESGSIHKNHLGADRFYPFIKALEDRYSSDTAILIGLRAEESLNRYRAMIKNPAIEGVSWSSKTQSGAVKLYPIYDFAFEDIWTYIAQQQVVYNKIYDFMFWKGFSINKMRVSNLIHEKAFKSLIELQEFEPETYEKIIARLEGTATAARYGGEKKVFGAIQLPEAYASWLEYRDFLLLTIPSDLSEKFSKRFDKHLVDENIQRQQCKQILACDWENNIAIIIKDKVDPSDKWKGVI